MTEFHDSDLHGFWPEGNWCRMRFTGEGYIFSEYRGADGVWRRSQAEWETIRGLRVVDRRTRSSKRYSSIWREHADSN